MTGKQKKQSPVFIHSNLAQAKEIFDVVARFWASGNTAEVRFATTGGKMTVQMSAELGPARDLRPGAPAAARGPPAGWQGPHGPPGQHEPGASRRRRNKRRRELFLKRKTAEKDSAGTTTATKTTAKVETSGAGPVNEDDAVPRADPEAEAVDNTCHECSFEGTDTGNVKEHMDKIHVHIPQMDGSEDVIKPDGNDEINRLDKVSMIDTGTDTECSANDNQSYAGTKPKNVGLEPKPITSHDMDRYGDMDIFLMQEAATRMHETRPTRPRETYLLTTRAPPVYVIKLNCEGRHIGEGTEGAPYPLYQLSEFLATPPPNVWHPDHGRGTLVEIDKIYGTYVYQFEDGELTET